MEFTRGIQFLFEDLRFAVRGDVARLTCIEHVLMPGDQSFEKVTDAPPSRLAVSSTLVRTEVGWRLWSHMSGPILTEVEREGSEEHRSKLHSLMRNSYAVFCWK